MNIGIVTFHWASNYGAVLQSYALQTALCNLGHKAEIIDYYPKQYRKQFFDIIFSRNLHSAINKWNDYCKEKKINKVINPYLMLSSQKYKAESELIDKPPLYDLYISGSDQIWNSYFTLQGENKPTLVYFLKFAKNGKKASYASSIGLLDNEDKYWELVLPELEKFSYVTVRENGAMKTLIQHGIQASLAPDPTLLLEKEEYLKFVKGQDEKIIFYVLQDKQKLIAEVKKKFEDKFGKKETKEINNVSINEWLGYVMNAKVVVTNSYHGIIFSIIFHRPFYAFLIEGELSGMNDRILTLLENFNLKDRIITKTDSIFDNYCKDIDWNMVEKRREIIKADGYKILKEFGDIM